MKIVIRYSFAIVAFALLMIYFNEVK